LEGRGKSIKPTMNNNKKMSILGSIAMFQSTVVLMVYSINHLGLEDLHNRASLLFKRDWDFSDPMCVNLIFFHALRPMLCNCLIGSRSPAVTNTNAPQKGIQLGRIKARMVPNPKDLSTCT
jgi:hypothetical protein